MEEKSKSRWQRLKKKATEEYQSAKNKYQNYKVDKENIQFTENIPGVNISSIDNNKSILRCSVCESPIPPELLSSLKKGNFIICEKCGSEISSQNTT